MIFYSSIFSLCNSFELHNSFLSFELVGILSFRLIGHYSGRISAVRGALISFGINRIGDVIILCLICILSTQTLDRGINSLCFLCLLSCGIKSVSFLSFLWLVDAMEGPSPVSALLHSATLVVAGILVFYRQFQLNCAELVFSASLFGLFATCTSATSDSDVKKVAAVSTCILIGVCFSFCVFGGSETWMIAILHAQYKSLIFFSLGLLLSDSNQQNSKSINIGSSLICSCCFLLLAFCTSLVASNYFTGKNLIKIPRGAGSESIATEFLQHNFVWGLFLTL